MSQWPLKPLGEICSTTSGGTPSRSRPEYFGGAIPWIKSGDLTDGDVIACDENITEEALRSSSAKLFSKGTVLVAMYGATVGKLGMLGIEAATNQAVCGITPSDELYRWFLFFFLLSQRQNLIGQSAGGAQPNISQKIVRELLVPVPSLPEQRRIVDLLSRAEGIVRLRREAEMKAAKLIPALFLDMFGDPATNPKGWPVAPLGDLLVSGPQNGLYKHSSHYAADGTPILRIDAFYDGRVKDISALRRVRLSVDECEKFLLGERDVVINRVNSPEYLGKSAIIPVLKEKTVFESNMMRFSVNEALVLPEYLIELLQTRHAKNQFLANAKHAINQSSINQQDVKGLVVLLPPVNDQRRFADSVEAIRSIQAQQITATAKAQATFDALLARAFSRDICSTAA